MVCSALTYPSQLVTFEVNCGTVERRNMPYLCYKVVSTLITFLTATKMTYRVRHSRRAGEIEDID